jgi:hypothetical protein
MLAVALLTACTLTPKNEGNNNDSMIETAVAQTQAAQEDAPEPEADYPAKQACSELGDLLRQHLGLEVAMGPETFSDMTSGLDGEGCQIAVGGTGEEVTDWGQNTSSFVQAMHAAGWEMDPNFSGGGAGGELQTVRRDGEVCLYISEVRPEDPSLCSGDEALVACLGRLDPAYILYDVTISCSPDSYGSTETDNGSEIVEQPAERITFEPGAISAYVNGNLNPSSSQRYVLRAMEGQEMVISLFNAPPHQGLVVIYGEDGTVLISDHAEATFWSGILPATQDYYISVHSAPDYALAYSMRVIIPPAGEMYTGAYQPMNSAACGELADLVSTVTGVEAMSGVSLFNDPIEGGAGYGCTVTAWGTLDLFPDRSATSAAMMSTMTANGWVENQQYGAAGPGGFGTGYTKDGNLCIYFEMVHELDPWVCDAYDGPIGNCWNALEETEMYFSIELNCATGN